MKKIHNYINGKSFSISKKDLPVEDPSKGEVIAKVVLSSVDDFEKILESSKKSQTEWANTTPLKRSRIISNYKTLKRLIRKKRPESSWNPQSQILFHGSAF